MNRFRKIRQLPALLLCAAVVFRLAVPAGYMPAASGSGLWFELCPEFVPAGFLATLNAAGSAASGHAGHGDHTDFADTESHAGHDEHQCPFGHMLSTAGAIDQVSDAPAVLVQPAPLLPFALPVPTAVVPHYRSRAPPA